MKRLILVILLSFAAFTIWAVDPVLNMSGSSGIDLHAYMGANINVFINLLPYNGQDGVPFDIMGEDVLGKVGDESLNSGRLFATWSLRTNTQTRVLRISATPLTHVPDEQSSAETEINYRLVFSLDTKNNTKLFVYSTGDDEPFAFMADMNDYETDQGETINMPVASSNQGVRIVLCKFSHAAVGANFQEFTKDDVFTIIPYTDEERNAWPIGEYSATITLTIGAN